MDHNAKIRNFALLAAAVWVLLVVAGFARNGSPASEKRKSGRMGEAQAQRSTESWSANSFVPESRLIREPSVKLSLAPPLPDENKTIEFKPLPQTNQRGRRYDLQATEMETASVDDQPPMQFTPLPQIKSLESRDQPRTNIVTRDLPRMKKITIHALPEFPVDSTRDAQASHQEAAPLEPADEAHAEDINLKTTADAVGETTGEDTIGKIRPLPPQKSVRFKDLPPPPVVDRAKVEQPKMTGFGFVERLPKSDQLFQPAARRLNSPSPASWNHPVKDAGVQLVSAELELAGPSGPNGLDTILGIPADREPADREPVSGKSADFEAPVTPVAIVAKLPKALLDKTKKKKKKKVVAAPKKGSSPKSASGKSAKAKDDFLLAAQPKLGAHYVEDKPQTDQHAHLIEPLASDFSPDPLNPQLPYEPNPQMNVYQGKTLNANQRPLVELGRPWYQLGQLSPGSSLLGFHNNLTPQFLVYGDHRTGYASNRQNGNSTSQIATQLNLDFDLKLTGTERFHAFVQPLTSGGRNTRRLLDDDEMIFEGSANPAFGYFEGDLGAIVGGATNKTLPFDLPFTAGIIPLVFQNGVWLEDAILGVAATLPAKNSPRFNISNMDITFFAGYDKIDSPAFQGDDSAARIMGIASFLEMLNGYLEIDYAFLDDRTFDDRSYHNIGIGYTRRYGRFVSNSTRVIVNAGQNSSVVDNTADGVLLLSENSLITGFPSNVVPYFNFFAGFDRPQSAARAAGSGGVLRNTGILFESDNLTGYPTLDATANDTYGMSLGVEVLSGGDRFSQQLVLETSMLGVMGDDATRNAAGDQYGVGFRYQLPLSNSVILRADGMYGFLRKDEDISGIRLEVRKKF